MNLRSLTLTGCALLLAALLGGCASERAPTGGARDTEPPRLLFTTPPEEARNFVSDEVVFYFDEFIKSGLSKTDVFISPVLPPSAYNVEVINRRIRVKFLEPLSPNTTYVLLLSKNVADNNEGNKLAAPIPFAFSTGPVLDSASVEGTVLDARTGQPAKDYTVLLFSADSVQDGNFRNRKPIYAASTTDDGRYRLPYLRAGAYRIFAIRDKDQDYRYSQPSEPVAVAAEEAAEIVPLNRPDSVHLTRNLIAFVPDSIPPRLMSVKWEQYRTVALEFSEPVHGGKITFTPDNLTDTLLTQDPAKPKRLLYHIPAAPPDTFNLRISQLADTLGNLLDTLVTLRPPAHQRFDTALKFTPIQLRHAPYRRRFLLNSPLGPDSTVAPYLNLVDTGGKTLPLIVHAQGYLLDIVPARPAEIDTNLKYTLRVDTGLISLDFMWPDSVLKIPYVVRELGKYGEMEGRFVVPEGAPPLFYTFYNTDTKDTLIVRGNTFRLPFAAAGTYTVTAVADLNGDGEWTPGFVWPRRMPEPVHQLPGKIKVRAGWAYENLEIKVPKFWE